MDSNYGNHTFFNTNMKLELLEDDDDLSMQMNFSSKGFLQESHYNFDPFSITKSTLNSLNQSQTNIFDPLENLFCDLSPSTDFDSYNFDENGDVMMHNNFEGGGFLEKKMENFDHHNILSLNCHDSDLLNFVVPDETSRVSVTPGNIGDKNVGSKKRKNTATNNLKVEDESSSGKNSSRGASKKSKSSKGQWTTEEDKLLIHLVDKFGVRKWSHIAQMLKGRIGKQCRERWHNHLRPDIKKEAWSEEEDRVLIEAHAQVGNKWAEIAKKLPGRTENSIKNHWNATKRRQLSRRKCRTKWPRPSSLLQNYIKSLNNSEKKAANASTNSFEEKHDFMDFRVPDYELDKLFEGSSIDGFMEDLSGGSEKIDEKCFDLGLPFDMPPLMQFGGKKELDLMEMISQVNV